MQRCVGWGFPYSGGAMSEKRGNRAVRCSNSALHQRHEGNLLAIIGQQGVYVKCQDRACKRWSLLRLSIPGVTVDWSKVGISQVLMPADYHFDLDKTVTVVGEQRRGNH